MPGLGDSIHVIGVNPATKHGTMLNVPRDTSAPDGNKINAHLKVGLPAFVEQIDKMMGIQIDYALTTDFPRFVNMVNGIGGIAIDLSTTELFRLGRLALTLDPADITNCTIPMGAGGASNLSVAPEAAALFADFADDGTVALCQPVPGGLDAPTPG